MNIQLILHTLIHLKVTQVFHQVKYRLVKPAYIHYDYWIKIQGARLFTEPIVKPKCLNWNIFSFLNQEHQFAGWDFTENGMLWAYNQNYFDWLNQDGLSETEGCKWIDRFIADVKGGFPMDPYPIALRSINWMKFFCKYPESAAKERVGSLYSQVKLLEKKLEYHLLGNHLLEDAYSLFINACYFGDEKLYKKASKLLKEQLEEQILPDGAHYEQSPMYHCILLDRLLDCINISLTTDDTDFTDKLKEKAERMLGHLESIKWGVGSLPLLNDSANGIAPTTGELFDYAKRLGLKWKKIPMKECGYRKIVAGGYEAIVDVGNITATYQPGHTHADTFNYELHIEGKPYVVDTGISTYNKTERRQLERSTVAHNCVVVDGKNSSEVWGGFRVGRRATVSVNSEEIKDNSYFIEASHNGFGSPCRRIFGMTSDSFAVEDFYDGEAVSYIHLAKDADEKRVKVEGSLSTETKRWKYSVEYNRFIEGKVIEIRFKGHCKYTIQ